MKVSRCEVKGRRRDAERWRGSGDKVGGLVCSLVPLAFPHHKRCGSWRNAFCFFVFLSVFELCLPCPLDSLCGLQQWMVVVVAAACVWFDWWCWWNSNAGCAAAGAGAAGGFCALPCATPRMLWRSAWVASVKTQMCSWFARLSIFDV